MTVHAPEKMDNLASRLRTMAKGRDTLDVARFQFIDLEDVRDAYGERWPAQKARIEDVAEGFLRRRINPEDMLITAGGGFLVVFGSAAGDAADAAAGALSHGLNEFFLGEVGETPSPRFAATSVAMPVKDLSDAFGHVEIKEIASPIEPSNLPSVDWRYQPVWDVRKETLSSWYLTPHSKKTSERLPGYQFESVSVTAAQLAAVDEAGLLVSEETLQELIPQGKQVLIGASIHASTMTNLATRAKILSIIDRFDQGLTRYRILKIAGVAPGFPRLYLNEIVSLLKAKVPNVVIGATWDEPDMAGLIQSGPVAVGVTLPRSVVGPSPAVPFEALIKKVAIDTRLAHGARMRFFVEGQIDHSLALRLAAMAVDNIASPRIWPASGIPTCMLKWPSSRMAAA
jgi:hypothetical protein